jgi:hypothetical protein
MQRTPTRQHTLQQERFAASNILQGLPDLKSPCLAAILLLAAAA